MSEQKEHKYCQRVTFEQESSNGDKLSRVIAEQYFDDKEAQVEQGTNTIQTLIGALLEQNNKQVANYIEKRRNSKAR